MGIKGEKIMCDIDSETRALRYKELRIKGYLRGFAQRARDFTDIRYQKAISRNMDEIKNINMIGDLK